MLILYFENSNFGVILSWSSLVGSVTKMDPCAFLLLLSNIHVKHVFMLVTFFTF